MEDQSALKARIKQLLVENLMLQREPTDITDDQPLFGPEGLGLDSVDALQLVVMLDKNYGIKIPNPEVAREVLQSVNSITEAVQKKLRESDQTPV